MLNETSFLNNEEKNSIKQFLEFYESIVLFQDIVSVANQTSLNEKLFVEFLHKITPTQMITKNDNNLNKSIEVMLILIHKYLFNENDIFCHKNVNNNETYSHYINKIGKFVDLFNNVFINIINFISSNFDDDINKIHLFLDFLNKYKIEEEKFFKSDLRISPQKMYLIYQINKTLTLNLTYYLNNFDENKYTQPSNKSVLKEDNVKDFIYFYTNFNDLLFKNQHLILFKYQYEMKIKENKQYLNDYYEKFVKNQDFVIFRIQYEFNKVLSSIRFENVDIIKQDFVFEFMNKQLLNNNCLFNDSIDFLNIVNNKLNYIYNYKRLEDCYFEFMDTFIINESLNNTDIFNTYLKNVSSIKHNILPIKNDILSINDAHNIFNLINNKNKNTFHYVLDLSINNSDLDTLYTKKRMINSLDFTDYVKSFFYNISLTEEHLSLIKKHFVFSDDNICSDLNNIVDYDFFIKNIEITILRYILIKYVSKNKDEKKGNVLIKQKHFVNNFHKNYDVLKVIFKTLIKSKMAMSFLNEFINDNDLNNFIKNNILNNKSSIKLINDILKFVDVVDYKMKGKLYVDNKFEGEPALILNINLMIFNYLNLKTDSDLYIDFVNDLNKNFGYLMLNKCVFSNLHLENTPNVYNEIITRLKNIYLKYKTFDDTSEVLNSVIDDDSFYVSKKESNSVFLINLLNKKKLSFDLIKKIMIELDFKVDVIELKEKINSINNSNIIFNKNSEILLNIIRRYNDMFYGIDDKDKKRMKKIKI